MKTILIIFLILFSFNLYAQKEDFTVFYSRGKVEIISSINPSKPILLSKPRTKLFATDKIRLYSSSDVILYHVSCGSIELNRAATYSIDSLAEVVINRKASNVISDYASFLAKEFMSDNDNIEDYSKKYMRDKGGVSRGRCSVQLLFPPFSAGIVDSQITFIWKNEQKEDLVLRIYKVPNDGIPLVNFRSTDATYKLPINSIPLEKQKVYYWSVTNADDQDCPRFPFKILNENEISKVKTEIDAVEGLTGVDPNVKLILKAACYEKNSLYLLAIEQFQIAIKSAPEDEQFKKLYSEFLARNGLLNESLNSLDVKE